MGEDLKDGGWRRHDGGRPERGRDDAAEYPHLKPRKQLTVFAAIFAHDLTAFKGNVGKHFSWVLYACVLASVILAYDDYDPIAADESPRDGRRLALRLDGIMDTASADFRSLVDTSSAVRATLSAWSLD